jgi:hypothetical protein
MAKTNTHVPAQWHDLVTDVRTAAQGPLYALGQYREEDGVGYRYAKFDNGTGNVASVAGGLAYSKDATTSLWTVTMDVSDTHRNQVVGVFVAVIGDLGFGWIQVKGYYATVTTNGDDDISAGDAIIASSAGDGTCDSTAAGTAPVAKVVGWATTADVDANNTVAVFLTLM